MTAEDTASLNGDLKRLIVETLRMEEISPEDIADAEPLFGDEGLGLDSVDALELVVHIEEKYGIQIEDEERFRLFAASRAFLARFISSSPK